jgi:hypothetical protein
MSKGGQTSPQIANPQIYKRIIRKSHICKFPWCSSLQIANPQICKEENSVSDPDPHWFASNIFF